VQSGGGWRRPDQIGWDAAGVVATVGPDVTLFQPGETMLFNSPNPSEMGSAHETDNRVRLSVGAYRLIGLDPDQLSLQAPFPEGLAAPMAGSSMAL
jgi:NADPH:quinone reductase-like Zn-dependent oxidoreductase